MCTLLQARNTSFLLVATLAKTIPDWLEPLSGNAEDDEPDKIAIAFGRFGRFKRFIVGGVKGFFLFIKNKIVQLFTGRRGRYDEDTFEVDEKVRKRDREVEIREIREEMGTED